MPDEHGFPTIQERKLGIEISKLRRENEILRRETGHLGPLKTFDEDILTEVQSLPHEFRVPMLAKATVSWHKDYTIRVVACCWPEGKNGRVFEVAEYLSDTVIGQTVDPFQTMMELYKIVLEEIARRSK